MEKTTKKTRTPLKERPLRLPGESLDRDIHKLQTEMVVYGILAIFLLVIAYTQWISWYYHAPPQPLLFFVLALIFMTYGFYKIYQMR